MIQMEQNYEADALKEDTWKQWKTDSRQTLEDTRELGREAARKMRLESRNALEQAKAVTQDVDRNVRTAGRNMLEETKELGKAAVQQVFHKAQAVSAKIGDSIGETSKSVGIRAAEAAVQTGQAIAEEITAASAAFQSDRSDGMGHS